MASPQKEHGFTPIANELLRAIIRLSIPGRRLRIWLALAIDSFGRSRKETTLSIREISKMTGIEKANVAHELKALGVSRMTLPGGSVARDTGIKIMRKINKDYDTWGVSPATPSVALDTGGSVANDTPHHRLTTVRAGGIKGVNVNTLRKEKRLTTPPAPAVRVLIDHFYQHLERHLGEKPVSFNGGALANLVKRALKTLNEGEIRARVDAWFQSTDQFIVSNGFSVTMFIAKFDLLKGGPIHAPKSFSQRSSFGVDPTPGKYANIDE